MYSYEDRIRAVKLYIKLGKRTGATIRQLGYPTKNALNRWFCLVFLLFDCKQGERSCGGQVISDTSIGC